LWRPALNWGRKGKRAKLNRLSKGTTGGGRQTPRGQTGDNDYRKKQNFPKRQEKGRGKGMSTRPNTLQARAFEWRKKKGGLNRIYEKKSKCLTKQRVVCQGGRIIRLAGSIRGIRTSLAVKKGMWIELGNKK